MTGDKACPKKKRGTQEEAGEVGHEFWGGEFGVKSILTVGGGEGRCCGHIIESGKACWFMHNRNDKVTKTSRKGKEPERKKRRGTGGACHLGLLALVGKSSSGKRSKDEGAGERPPEQGGWKQSVCPTGAFIKGMYSGGGVNEYRKGG